MQRRPGPAQGGCEIDAEASSSGAGRAVTAPKLARGPAASRAGRARPGQVWQRAAEGRKQNNYVDVVVVSADRTVVRVVSAAGVNDALPNRWAAVLVHRKQRATRLARLKSSGLLTFSLRSTTPTTTSISIAFPHAEAMTTLRCGGGLRIKKKARGFMCGCGGSKAISISDGGSDKQSSPVATPPANNMASTTTTTTTRSTTTATRSEGNKTVSSAAAAQSSFSPSSSYYADDTDVDAQADTSVGSTPSVAPLLRQLSELERSVRSLQGAAAGGRGGGAAKDGGRWHRRTVSDGGGGGSGRVEESVAVVKESADPLTDFRQSMLQMIVEKEIVSGTELRELLHRFLSLNSPHHHHVILRAFAEIWEEVFAGYEPTPDFLVSHRKKKQQLPSYAAAAATDDMWTVRN
ncbi:hypothetical protein GUJ93_ZPchr0012g20112 [Zizania palustris]|uniref:Transcription repressor n=1 Tax=Zizania palustris TaxID=103762 RepID=A0A8J5WPJ4_ZIZPA|nr:hypothetical protein GUJ93_ZPchr0012g20112 [Zizania palustris]